MNVNVALVEQWRLDSEIDGVTELQPGSFLFMDVDYNRIGGQDGPVYRDFRNALSVIVFGGISCQLENFGDEVFEYCSLVDWSPASNSLAVKAEIASNSAHWKLQTGTFTR